MWRKKQKERGTLKQEEIWTIRQKVGRTERSVLPTDRRKINGEVDGVFVRVGMTERDDIGRGIGLTDAAKLTILDMNRHIRIILNNLLKGSTRFQDRYSSS